MLHAGQALGGVVVLVVYVQIVSLYGLSGFLTQQIVVHKGLGGFAGKLHHHPRRCVRVHVGIFAGHVVVLDVDYFQKHVACLGFAGYAALVAVGNILLSHLFPATLHQLHFHHVLYGLYCHLWVASERDAVRYLLYQLSVFALFGVQHGFTDGGGYLLLVEAYYSSVSFNDCLYHDSSVL